MPKVSDVTVLIIIDSGWVGGGATSPGTTEGFSLAHCLATCPESNS